MKQKALNWLAEQVTDEKTKAELDIIEFIKQCVKAHKKQEREKAEESGVDLDKYFKVLWGLYPKKVAKVQAKKTFEHKVRGLTKEQCDTKCNAIYKAEKKYIEYLKANDTQLQYVKHFSSWLNSEVPDSPKFKGRKVL